MTAISVTARVTADHRLQLKLPDDFPPGPVTVIIEPVNSDHPTTFAPKTELGRHLLAIRQRALANGMQTYTQDQVLAEVRRRRGEPIEND